MFKFFDKYCVLLGAFLIEFTIGYLYSSVNLQKNIVNYMTNNSLSGKSVSESNTFWIFGAVTLGTGASVSLGGYLELKFGAWITVLIGSWFMSLNFGLMYFTLRSYLSIVIITFGLFGGIGVGIAYGVALGAAAKRFSKNRGLIFGIAVAGFSLSTIFSNEVQKFLMKDEFENSNNQLPKFFGIISLIYFVIQIFAALLMRRKSDETLNKSTVNYESFNSETRKNHFFNKTSHPIEIEPHKLILEFDFWILWLIGLLISTNNHFIILLNKKYFEVIGFDLIFSDIYIILPIFNCFGRILWGYLFDKIRFKKIMIILTLLDAIFIGTLPVFISINFKYNEFVAVAWFAIIHFSFGGYFSVSPSTFAELFGMKYFACNYGMLFTAGSVSSTITGIVLHSINTKENQLSIIFGIGGMLSLLGTLLTILLRGKSLIAQNM